MKLPKTNWGDAEAVVKEKQEKALAEHVADHPEDVQLQEPVDVLSVGDGPPPPPRPSSATAG